MTDNICPEISDELQQRIRLVRRDMGNLLFHFTRAPEGKFIVAKTRVGELGMSASAYSVLNKILYEESLKGSSKWTYGKNCICFTEAPIIEFNSIFTLNEIASSIKERPRYEPFGIAVSKKWLYEKGGRPVIYDHPDNINLLPDDLKYRFVPYDPVNGIDYTWEREWRMNADFLKLDPKHTLVVVPTSEEAFNIVYEFADMKPDYDYADGEEYIIGAYHKPKWLAVSLDLFGFTY
ncbi:MAG: hypothetical protein ACYDIA_02290 [Candidatus Humimicrobiaceae bacterium]